MLGIEIASEFSLGVPFHNIIEGVAAQRGLSNFLSTAI
jgi:hypothetical protein